ncbi:MAG: DUF1559 domain-containing protein [Gemmataceae bacterium]
MRIAFRLGCLALLLPAAARAEERPAELAAVPNSALAFVHIRVAELWKSDAMKDIRGLVQRAGDDALKAFDQRFVPSPSIIDRVTLVLLPDDEGRRVGDFVVVIGVATPLDSAKVIKTSFPNANPIKVGDTTLHADPQSGLAIHVVDNRTAVLGAIDPMRHYLGLPRDGAGPFASVLAGAGKSQVVAVFNSSQLPPEGVGQLPPPLQPLARARLMQLSVNWDKDIRIDLKLTFADDAQAQAGEDAAKAGIEMVRQELAKARQEIAAKLSGKGPAPLAELPEMAVALVALGSLKQADEILRDLPLKRAGSALASNATIPAGPATSALSMWGYSAALLLPAVERTRRAAARASSSNNLKQMALAMHNYESAFASLPTAAICDKNGKPLLSWRVAILPFIEQDNLYRAFHLDEPWDSDHNKKLIAQMPRVYAIPGVTNPGETNTHYRVFYNNDAMFDLTKKISLTQVADGLSNTLMIVEANEAVPWSKPEELLFEPTKPLPKLGKQSPDGFMAAMGDGSVRLIKHKVSEKTIKALITRSGGEIIDYGELEK